MLVACLQYIQCSSFSITNNFQNSPYSIFSLTLLLTMQLSHFAIGGLFFAVTIKAAPNPRQIAHRDLSGYDNLGCYTEATSGRALSQKSYADNSMTLELCQSTCQDYAYFGVEYGREVSNIPFWNLSGGKSSNVHNSAIAATISTPVAFQPQLLSATSSVQAMHLRPAVPETDLMSIRLPQLHQSTSLNMVIVAATRSLTMQRMVALFMARLTQLLT